MSLHSRVTSPLVQAVGAPERVRGQAAVRGGLDGIGAGIPGEGIARLVGRLQVEVDSFSIGILALVIKEVPSAALGGSLPAAGGRRGRAGEAVLHRLDAREGIADHGAEYQACRRRCGLVGLTQFLQNGGRAVSMPVISTAWVRVSSPWVRVMEYQPFSVTVRLPVTRLVLSVRAGPW